MQIERRTGSQGDCVQKKSNSLPGKSCPSCQEIKLCNNYHNLILKQMKCPHTKSDCCCKAFKKESLVPNVSNEAVKNSKKAQDHVSGNFQTQHHASNDDVFYRCHVCRRSEVAGEEYQGKTPDRQKKVARENLCRAAQYIVDSTLPYEHLGTLVSFLKLVLPPDKVNYLGNGHPSTQNFKDLTLSNFEAGKKQIKDKMDSINVLTKQRRKCAIAVGKDTVPFDASRQIIVASYMEDDGSIQEVLISAGRVSSHSADDAFKNVTKCCADYVETTNIVAVCADETSNCVGRHTVVFDRMKSDPSYNDKMIHLPDLCHRMELLLKNTLPAWLQKTLSEASTISQKLSVRSPLSQRLTELSNADSNWIFFPVTSISETRYFEHTHHLIDSILKNLELLHHFLPILLKAPDLRHIHNEVSVICTIIMNPVFVSNLLFVNALFVEAINLKKIAQDRNFSPNDFVKIVEDFRKFLESLRTRLPSEVGKFVTTRKFNYTYLYSEREYNVNVDFSDEKRDWREVTGRYFQWMHKLLLNFDSYLEIPEAVKKISGFFNVENVDENYQVELFKFIFQTYAIDFYSCGDQCEGIDECLCVAKEFQTFSGCCKKYSEECTENGKFAHTKFLRLMLLMKRKHLMIPNIYRLIEFFALLKSNQSSTERVRSIIARTVHRQLKTCSQDPAFVTPDMTEVMVFLQSNIDVFMVDLQEAANISVTSGLQEALTSANQQSSGVATLNRRKTMKTENKRKQKNIDPHNSEKKLKLNDRGELSCSPSPQPSLQQTDPSSLSSLDEQPQSDPQHHLPICEVILKRLKTEETECKKKQTNLNKANSKRKLKLNDQDELSRSPNDLNPDSPPAMPSPSSPHESSPEPSPQLTDPSSLSSSAKQPPSAPEHHLLESAPSTPAASANAKSSPSSTHLLQSIPPVASPIHIEEEYSTTLFCLCLEPPRKSPDEAFISCARGKDCLSRSSRWRRLKADGGNWFHPKCVGLNEAPKGTWLCPLCKKRKLVLFTVQPDKTDKCT